MIDSPEYWVARANIELARGNTSRACDFYVSAIHLASADQKSQYQAERAELIKRLEHEQNKQYVRTMSQVGLNNNKQQDKQPVSAAPDLPRSQSFDQ